MLEKNVLQEERIPQLMRAVAVGKPNDQIDLIDIEIAVPECSDNDLLVKIESVGLNPRDAQFIDTGFCGKWTFPHVLGLDAVGIVVQAPKGVHPNIGERVMWHADVEGQGVLSEYAKVPNFAVSVVPDKVGVNEAATLPSAGMAAIIAISKVHLMEGFTLFVESGASAVGQFAIQLAKQAGADVFTTASKCNHGLVRKLGADVVFDYREKNLCQKLNRELGGQGFDAVIDLIGGEATIRNIRLMRFCGRIACLKPLPVFEDYILYKKAPNISVVSLDGAWISKSLCAQQKMGFMGNSLLESVANGDIKVPKITPVAFNAKSVTAALHKQLAGGFTGKQIVEIIKS
jgi:NADPH:quinone reductase-like Zn-dependent oxidoreductase